MSLFVAHFAKSNLLSEFYDCATSPISPNLLAAMIFQSWGPFMRQQRTHRLNVTFSPNMIRESRPFLLILRQI